MDTNPFELDDDEDHAIMLVFVQARTTRGLITVSLPSIINRDYKRSFINRDTVAEYDIDKIPLLGPNRSEVFSIHLGVDRRCVDERITAPAYIDFMIKVEPGRGKLGDVQLIIGKDLHNALLIGHNREWLRNAFVIPSNKPMLTLVDEI